MVLWNPWSLLYFLDEPRLIAKKDEGAMRRRLLVADDSSTILKVIKIAFARFAMEMVEAGSLIEALSNVTQTRPDGLIVDAGLPGTRGPEDFQRLRAEAQNAPMLLLVGTYDAFDEVAFRQAGFSHILKKPFESGDIVAAVEDMLGTSLTVPPPPSAVQAAPTPQHVAMVPPPPPAPPTAGRSQHATVVHSSGFPGLNELTNDVAINLDNNLLDLPSDLAPPSPVIVEENKGRRAFAAPEAPIFQIDSSQILGAEKSPDGEPLISDLNLDLGDLDTESTLPLPDLSALKMPLTPAEPAPPASPAAEEFNFNPEFATGSKSQPKAAEPPPDWAQHLPVWVRQAVEDYCERHFKTIAREVITAELRRLADEKARHLVDN